MDEKYVPKKQNVKLLPQHHSATLFEKGAFHKLDLRTLEDMADIIFPCYADSEEPKWRRTHFRRLPGVLKLVLRQMRTSREFYSNDAENIRLLLRAGRPWIGYLKGMRTLRKKCRWVTEKASIDQGIDFEEKMVELGVRTLQKSVSVRLCHDESKDYGALANELGYDHHGILFVLMLLGLLRSDVIRGDYKVVALETLHVFVKQVHSDLKRFGVPRYQGTKLPRYR